MILLLPLVLLFWLPFVLLRLTLKLVLGLVLLPIVAIVLLVGLLRFLSHRFRLPAQSEIDDALQQRLVRDSHLAC